MKRNDNNNREKLLEDIMDRVNYGSVILYGVRKIGETALFSQIEKRLSKSFIFVYVDLENAESAEEFFNQITNRVVDVCRSHLDVSEPRTTGLEAGYDFWRVLNKIVGQLNGQKSLVLLLDGVDTTKIHIQALDSLRGIYMSFVGQLRLIMAGVIVYESSEVMSPWWNFFHIIDATPFVEINARPVKSFIQRFIANILHRNKGEKQP